MTAISLITFPQFYNDLVVTRLFVVSHLMKMTWWPPDNDLFYNVSGFIYFHQVIILSIKPSKHNNLGATR